MKPPELPTEEIPVEISQRDATVVNPELKYANEIWKVLEKHWKLFIGRRKDRQGKLIFAKLSPYKLKLKAEGAFTGDNPRNYPQNQLKTMEAGLNKLEAAGIIERTDSPLATSCILMVEDTKKHNTRNRSKVHFGKE